jgi:hypothetical protein
MVGHFCGCECTHCAGSKYTIAGCSCANLPLLHAYSARASCFAVQQLLSCKFHCSQGAFLCEEQVYSSMCVQQGHVIGACADLLLSWRAGRYKEACELCANAGQPWRGVSLAGVGPWGPLPVGDAAAQASTTLEREGAVQVSSRGWL